MTIITTPRTTGEVSASKRALSEALSIASRGDETGIIEDYIGTAWRVTADGSSTTVTVGQVGNKIRIRGHFGEITAPETLTLPSPGAGQQRLDLIVARLALTSPYAITTVAIPGTPATIGSATAPLPVVIGGSFWDEPLALVDRTGTSAVTPGAITEYRRWLGGEYTALRLPLPSQVPIGSIVHIPGQSWLRSAFEDGSGSPGFTLIRESVLPRMVVRQPGNQAYGPNAWSDQNLTVPFGIRGQTPFQLGQGQYGQSLRCLIPGEYIVHCVASFNDPDVALRLVETLNTNNVQNVLDQSPEGQSASRQLSVMALPLLSIGDLLTIQARSPTTFAAIPDNGDALGGTNPGNPFKLTATLLRRL